MLSTSSSPRPRLTLAVIDSGVAPHPDFGSRRLPAVNPHLSLDEYLAAGPTQPLAMPAEAFPHFFAAQMSAPDLQGHGTLAAGIAAGDGSSGGPVGVAPEAAILPMHVVGGGAGPFFAGLKQSLEYLIEHGQEHNVRVVNLSVSHPVAPGEDPLDDCLRRANQAGLCLVVAAGNSGPELGSLDCSPALHPDVITVGGYDPGRAEVWLNSSRALPGQGKPDLLAPAVDILGPVPPDSQLVQQALKLRSAHRNLQALDDAALLHKAQQIVAAGKLPASLLQESPQMIRQRLVGPLQPPPLLEREGQVLYLAGSGTSFAGPQVSGAALRLLEINPELTPGQVKTILMGTADLLPGVPLEAQGAGLLNLEAALAQARASLGGTPPATADVVAGVSREPSGTAIPGQE